MNLRLGWILLIGIVTMIKPLQAAPELQVFAAASLADALKEIGANYKGVTINFNLAASSILARQIEEGAPADVFISADEAKMDGLEKKGLLVPGTRHDLLGNTLVVVAALEEKGTLTSVQDLVKDKKAKIVIAQPDTVPAGIYAKEYLTKLGFWDALQDQFVMAENVRAALSAVEAGNAQYGFVYKTDALISKKVHVVLEVPASEGPKIVYPVAIVASQAKAARDPAPAQAFLAYLFTPAAQAVFQKYGFQVLSAPTSAK
jgi:molybdate transport system substrate-binding protein